MSVLAAGNLVIGEQHESSSVGGHRCPLVRVHGGVHVHLPRLGGPVVVGPVGIGLALDCVDAVSIIIHALSSRARVRHVVGRDAWPRGLIAVTSGRPIGVNRWHPTVVVRGGVGDQDVALVRGAVGEFDDVRLADFSAVAGVVGMSVGVAGGVLA